MRLPKIRGYAQPLVATFTKQQPWCVNKSQLLYLPFSGSESLGYFLTGLSADADAEVPLRSARANSRTGGFSVLTHPATSPAPLSVLC